MGHYELYRWCIIGYTLVLLWEGWVGYYGMADHKRFLVDYYGMVM